MKFHEMNENEIASALRTDFTEGLDEKEVKSRHEQHELMKKLERLKKRCAPDVKMQPNHVEILSDLLTLQIYLLAQNKSFKFSIKWIKNNLNGKIQDENIEKRINLLIESGLWKKVENGKHVVPFAPNIKTGNNTAAHHLLETHINILRNAQTALRTQNSKERIFGGRTFLVNKNDISKIQERIDDFKKSLETDFENLDSTNVYQLEVVFFELKPTEKV